MGNKIKILNHDLITGKPDKNTVIAVCVYNQIGVYVNQFCANRNDAEAIPYFCIGIWRVSRVKKNN